MNTSDLLSNLSPSFPAPPDTLSTVDLYYKVLGIPGLIMYFRTERRTTGISGLCQVQTLPFGA